MHQNKLLCKHYREWVLSCFDIILLICKVQRQLFQHYDHIKISITSFIILNILFYSVFMALVLDIPVWPIQDWVHPHKSWPPRWARRKLLLAYLQGYRQMWIVWMLLALMTSIRRERKKKDQECIEIPQ